jgi:hypothetical protein
MRNITNLGATRVYVICVQTQLSLVLKLGAGLIGTEEFLASVTLVPLFVINNLYIVHVSSYIEKVSKNVTKLPTCEIFLY